MKKKKLQFKRLLSWHRKCKGHPLFNPKYARENLASLIESMLKIYLYLTLVFLIFHLFVLNGYPRPETMSWLLIEASSSRLGFWLSDAAFLNPNYVSLSIFGTIILIKVSGIAFAVIKANLHPGSNENFSRHLQKERLKTDNS